MRAYELYENRVNMYGSAPNTDYTWWLVIDELNEEFSNSDIEKFFNGYTTDYKEELKQGDSTIGDWYVNVQFIPAGKQSRLVLVIRQISDIMDKSVFKKEISIDGLNIGAIVFKDREAANSFAQLIKFRYQDDFDIVVKL